MTADIWGRTSVEVKWPTDSHSDIAGTVYGPNSGAPPGAIVDKDGGAILIGVGRGTKLVDVQRVGGAIISTTGGASKKVDSSQSGGSKLVLSGGAIRITERNQSGGASLNLIGGADKFIVRNKDGGATLILTGGGGISDIVYELVIALASDISDTIINISDE